MDLVAGRVNGTPSTCKKPSKPQINTSFSEVAQRWPPPAVMASASECFPPPAAEVGQASMRREWREATSESEAALLKLLEKKESINVHPRASAAPRPPAREPFFFESVTLTGNDAACELPRWNGFKVQNPDSCHYDSILCSPRTGDLEFLPPPGVLEYIWSRRSDEILSRLPDNSGTAASVDRRSNTDPTRCNTDTMRAKDNRALFHVTRGSSSLASKKLLRICDNQRNQKEYNPDLHEMFRSVLKSDKQAVSAPLLRKLAMLKIGIDPMKDSTMPTPLRIQKRNQYNLPIHPGSMNMPITYPVSGCPVFLLQVARRLHMCKHLSRFTLPFVRRSSVRPLRPPTPSSFRSLILSIWLPFDDRSQCSG